MVFGLLVGKEVQSFLGTYMSTKEGHLFISQLE
jgi:hypothetical protein